MQTPIHTASFKFHRELLANDLCSSVGNHFPHNNILSESERESHLLIVLRLQKGSEYCACYPEMGGRSAFRCPFLTLLKLLVDPGFWFFPCRLFLTHLGNISVTGHSVGVLPARLSLSLLRVGQTLLAVSIVF